MVYITLDALLSSSQCVLQIAAAHLQNPDLVVALTAGHACHSLVSSLLEQAQVSLPAAMDLELRCLTLP